MCSADTPERQDQRPHQKSQRAERDQAAEDREKAPQRMDVGRALAGSTARITLSIELIITPP